VQIPQVLIYDKNSQHIIENEQPRNEITQISQKLYTLTFERSLESPKHAVILKIIFKSIITLCNYSNDDKIKFEDFSLCTSNCISFASYLYKNDPVEFTNVILKINNNFADEIEIETENKTNLFNKL